MIPYWLISYVWRHPGGEWQFANDVINYHFTDWCLKFGIDSEYTDEYKLVNAIEITRTMFEKLDGRLQ
jgi:hypothetical protein